MPIDSAIEHASSVMHTLATADVLPNTFGMVSALNLALKQVLAQLRRDGAGLAKGTAERLRQLLTTIEENRLLFAVPEQWLIDDVFRSVKEVRQRLGG